MRRAKTNEAAERVEEWGALWRAFVAARASGDFDRIEAARRAIEDFDRRHGLQPLRCTRRGA
jgi:hypothetical protein